jgi:hypothetical protein
MRTVDDLLGDADIAMYQAKALGKGRHQVFASSAIVQPSGEPSSQRWIDRVPRVRRPVHPNRLEPETG